MREAGLRLKPAKCKFLKESVEYLGHVVSGERVSPDPRKVETVQKFAVPANLKMLQLFLGLASYYHRFVPNYSMVANPLFALTCKDTTFVWTPAYENALKELK